MGLFDPPHVSIRKKLPAEALLGFDIIESAVAVKTEGWPDWESKLAIGFVTSVWAANTAAYGGFSLTVSVHRYVMDAGALCHRKLSVERRADVEAVLNSLIASGVVPGK